MTLNAWFSKRLIIAVLGLASALSTLTYLLVTHHISPRDFGIAALLLWVAMFVIVILLSRQFIALKKVSNDAVSRSSEGSFDAKTRRRLERQVRMFRTWVILMPLILLYGLWETRGESLLPRLVGATINILMTAAFFRAMRNVQARLKQSEGIS